MTTNNLAFISSVESWQGGGNCMIDIVALSSGQVLSITGDTVVLHESMEECEASFENTLPRNQVIYLTEEK